MDYNAIKYCSNDIKNKYKEYPFLYKLLLINFIYAIPEAIGLILFIFNLIFFTRWYHSIKSLKDNYSNENNNNNRSNNDNPIYILNIHTNIMSWQYLDCHYHHPLQKTQHYYS